MARDAGFTLIELLVVLAIMGLMLAAVLPGRFGGEGLELRAAARAMADGLQRARSLAVVSGEETVFAVDVANRQFQGPGDARPAVLPPRVRLALRTVRGAVAGPDVGGIRFFPDGGSTGGGIVLGESGEDGHQYRISVSWLTGRVEVSDDP